MTDMFAKVRGTLNKYLINRERTKESVRKEDFLMKQIDEIRDKATQLQQLLDNRQARVEELQYIVTEREGKAKELQDVLTAKKVEAEVIKRNMDQYVNQISGELKTQMEELRALVIDSKLDEDQQKLIRESMDRLSKKMDDVKEELSEKIHSESVKNYRNVQSLVEETNTKMEAKIDAKYVALSEDLQIVRKKAAGAKGAAVTGMIFGIINFAILAAMVLYEAGIVDYLLSLF